MLESKKTLFVGAHPDDVLLGAGITISRDPKNAQVIILSNGATIDEQFPAIHGNMTFNSYEEFAKKRIAEDTAAMRGLGLDLSQYKIVRDFPTEHAYTQIAYQVCLIDAQVRQKGIERLVTHQLEAHPDHDIACFATHYVAHLNGLEVWEYPLYMIDENGKEVPQKFFGDFDTEVVENVYSPDESRLKDTLMNQYESQIYIVDMFREQKDLFRRMQRDFSKGLPPNKQYFYKDEPGHPTPDNVNRAISDFLRLSRGSWIL